MKLYYLAFPEEVLDEGEGLDVVENFLNLGVAPVGGGGVAMWCLARVVPRLRRRDGVVPGQRSVVSLGFAGVWCRCLAREVLSPSASQT